MGVRVADAAVNPGREHGAAALRRVHDAEPGVRRARVKGRDPQSESTGNSNQVLLFRNFQRLFRLEDGEFLSCIQEVLDLFANRNNAALQDDLPFRFVQNLNLNKEQRQLFTRLIQLFQTASNVELRGAVAARTNLAEISRLMGDDRAAQRLEAFFK